jgi:hypothetical protein
MFKDLFILSGFKYDYQYDWLEKKENVEEKSEEPIK